MLVHCVNFWNNVFWFQTNLFAVFSRDVVLVQYHTKVRTAGLWIGRRHSLQFLLDSISVHCQAWNSVEIYSNDATFEPKSHWTLLITPVIAIFQRFSMQITEVSVNSDRQMPDTFTQIMLPAECSQSVDMTSWLRPNLKSHFFKLSRQKRDSHGFILLFDSSFPTKYQTFSSKKLTWHQKPQLSLPLIAGFGSSPDWHRTFRFQAS